MTELVSLIIQTTMPAIRTSIMESTVAWQVCNVNINSDDDDDNYDDVKFMEASNISSMSFSRSL